MCESGDCYNLAKTVSGLSVYKSNITGTTLKKKTTTDHKDAGSSF